MFLHNWAVSGFFGMVADFEEVSLEEKEFNATKCPANMFEDDWLKNKAKMAVALEQYAGVNVLLASYVAGNYDGDAFVLFEKDGKLYEINASHCSCHGLKGQWEPEETSVPALRKRLTDGDLGKGDYTGNGFAAELGQVLDQIELTAE